MIIIPLPWDESDMEYLKNQNRLFDLYMKESIDDYYLIIQNNKVTWLGMGNIPDKYAFQVRSRSITMNESASEDDAENVKNHGNVGIGGTYSSVWDAVTKIFPQEGHGVSNMNLYEYYGQKLRCDENHHAFIEPICCLLSDSSKERLAHFFDLLGWEDKKVFTSSGTWGDMHLYIDGEEMPDLESWFLEYSKLALGKEIKRPVKTEEKKDGSDAIYYVITAIFIFVIWKLILK